MGYAEKTKNQIYKDNRVQDYYTNSTNNGTHEMNTGLKLFGKLKELLKTGLFGCVLMDQQYFFFLTEGLRYMRAILFYS